eukprot:gene299-3668_t
MSVCPWSLCAYFGFMPAHPSSVLVGGGGDSSGPFPVTI